MVGVKGVVGTTLAVLALASAGSAVGAGGYTGPVAGVAWTPSALPGATVGVGYGATITASPAGATRLAVGCSTKSLTGFPPPPVAFDDCSRLPRGLTATGGSELTISGAATSAGSYGFRLIVVWSDADGKLFYALQAYSIVVSVGAASPPCKCESVHVAVKRVTLAPRAVTLDVRLSVRCTSGSGANCQGTMKLRPPVHHGVAASWSSTQRAGNDKPVPVAGGTAAVASLSCFGPCGHDVTAEYRVIARGAALTSAARRAGTTWTIAVLPACAGERAHQKLLKLVFDRAGRLDKRRSALG